MIIEDSIEILKTFFKKKILIVFVITFLVSSLISLIFPYLFSDVVSLYINNELTKNILRIVVLLVCQLVLILVREIYGYYKSIYVFNIDIHMKGGFFELVSKRNIRFSQTKHSGEIQHRMFNDITNIINNIFIFIVEVPVIFILVVVIIILISKINLIFLFFSLFMMIVMVTQYNLIQPIFKEKITKTKNISQSITGELNEYFNQIEIINSYNYEDVSLTKFNIRFNELYKSYCKQTKTLTIGNLSSNIIFQFWIGGVFFINVILLSQNKLSVPDFIMVFSYANIIPSLWSILISILWKYQDYCVSLKRYKEYFKVDLHEGNISIDSIKSIQFKNLTYYYEDNKVFREINTTFLTDKNKILNICGKNGSGKSTLLKILYKQLPIDNNLVFINGLEINSVVTKSLRNHMSIATQTPYIINGSIQDNILMGQKKYDKKLYDSLLKILGINNMIKMLGISMKDNLYKNKILLSGGEKQKINLARALLKNKNVVILDEPFRNLDELTVKSLKDYLLKSKKNIFYIIISHDACVDEILSDNDYKIKVSKGD